MSKTTEQTDPNDHHENLRELLRELKSELAQSDPDSDLAALGKEVEGDLHGWLSKTGVDEPNLALLKRAVAEFEANHPRASQVLHQMAELIKNLGV